jgi:hypothetical protein
MEKTKRPQFGELPPKYNFVLNPYPDMRISRCPFCGNKTGQKKIPLLIHVDPSHLIALNYTCRYCRTCDLLIAHRHALEHLLVGLFGQINPDAIGNQYLIFGTEEKKMWREGMVKPKAVCEILPHASDFVSYYPELRVTQAGWYGPNQRPPVREPPPSQEWVKSNREPHGV